MDLTFTPLDPAAHAPPGGRSGPASPPSTSRANRWNDPRKNGNGPRAIRATL